MITNSGPGTAPPSGVTVVITRRVKPGCEAAFEGAVAAWGETAATFPGRLAVLLLRPPPGGDEYGAVLRFRSAADWQAFRDRPEYIDWQDRIRPLLSSPPAVQERHGLEAWFQPAGGCHPPRWKMALVTWLGVNLTAYALTLTWKPLTESWPFFFAFVTFNAGVVGGLTWAVMPVLTRLFRRWL